ncbi:histidine phosphatase superfamily [Phycomyces nitens]|nr:histidine phosphatase superfamily [Phycomyces nitens]
MHCSTNIGRLEMRHGNTDANVEKWLQGHTGKSCTNTTLNACGLSQATRVGERLSREKFDKVYCSSLTRCSQTAAAITAHHPGLQTVYRDGLRERSFGKLEGQPIRAAFGDLKRSSRSSDDYIREAGGETEAEFRSRVCSAYKDIVEEAKAAKETDILIVTHGGPLRNLTHWW